MSRIGQSRIHAITPVRQRTREITGLGGGTMVLTMDGELPVEHLAAGDRIITRAGARVLRRISSHMVRDAWMISASALGDGRPEAPVAVGLGQQILVRDWRAKALTGKDSATIAVSRLADGEYIAACDDPVRLWRLEFEREEVIYAGGLEVTIPAPEDNDI